MEPLLLVLVRAHPVPPGLSGPQSFEHHIDLLVLAGNPNGLPLQSGSVAELIGLGMGVGPLPLAVLPRAPQQPTDWRRTRYGR